MTTQTNSTVNANIQPQIIAEQFRSETERLLNNRALLQKVLRMLHCGQPVLMRDRNSCDYQPVVNVELSGNQFLGYRDRNEVPWNGIFSDHVLIDGEKYRLNVMPTELIDPAIEMLDLTTALNSMMNFRAGSVFIACSFYNGDDFFLVRHFQTDGSSLNAIAAHDGSCHNIAPGCGWVYDLRHRRYVYGEGGPLRDGIQ